MNDLTVAVPTNEGGALMQIIGRAVLDPNLDVAKLQALLDVRRQYEADEARKAYHRAFAAFKSEATRIVKNKGITDGPLKGKRYADLFAVVDAVTPILSKHGLSHSWITTKNDKEWIDVACILTHEAGHSERREFGGPPDAGGAKNPIQARASTLSYLQRYTLLMVVGMASADQDDDGRGGQEDDPTDESAWTAEVIAAATEASEAGYPKFKGWWQKQTTEFRDAVRMTKRYADLLAKAQEKQ